jgi:hypothetical protein
MARPDEVPDVFVASAGLCCVFHCPRKTNIDRASPKGRNERSIVRGDCEDLRGHVIACVTPAAAARVWAEDADPDSEGTGQLSPCLFSGRSPGYDPS